MVRCQDLDLYGFPLVGLTGREAAAIAVRADDGKRMQRWRRQDPSWLAAHSLKPGLVLQLPSSPGSPAACQQLQASQHSSAANCSPASPPQSTIALLQDLPWQPSSNVPAPKSLKTLARDGIPAELRPTLWVQLSGGLALKKAAPPSYYRNLTRLGSKEAKLGGISSSDADIFRTFRNHATLNSFQAIAAVRRIVLGYGRRNPDAPFTRNLNFVVAFLLAVLGMDREEDVFWILAALLEQCLHPSCVLEGGRGCNVEQRVFEALAERKFPRLLEVFDRLECSMGRLTEEWFKCLFVTVLPAETTARVWDCMFVEGPKVLHRVGLSLLKMNEAPLLTTCHSIQVARILKWRVARMYSAEVLLKIAFKGLGTFKTEVLVQMRTAQEKALVAELTAHKKRLEDILCTTAARDLVGSNPLASALGHVKTPRLPSATSCARMSGRGLRTILESPIEMY